MLHGRESLVRLIGKRRRAFFSPLAHRLRSQNDSDSGEAMPIHSKEHEPLIEGDRSRQARVAELVSCPVCNASVRGDDFSLNSHLDACLSKGKKRKLRQRTLLQVNFLSKSRGETCLVEAGNANADKCGKGISEESQISNFHRSDVLMLYGNDVRCESPKSMNSSLCNSEFGSGTSTLKVMDEDSVNGQTVDPHFPSGFSSTINAPRNGFCQDKDKDVSTLETFIVGRRFHEKVVLQHGARVYTLREPKNPKDDNAIKVFFEDQGCRYPLGYLPRELAKYLSPLIDNRKLECEGSISSLPEHPLDPVPIILFCQKLVDDIISQNQENFDSLWQKALLANESAKALPTNMTKYQQNFCLMLEDVMDSHSHLFTIEEKNLIGSFSSLSGDAQRLLIRLYTRKGPWFRLSNISYKEISDLNVAVHTLQTTGYLCSLSLGVQSLKYDDMKEVLNVLTVSELQHISNHGLFKSGIHHVRRQELIEYILSASKNRSCILQKMVFEHVGTCVKITSTVEAILWRIQRLFFLNGEQDLSAFLLVDIGLIKYPEYTCIVSKPIFSCHSDLLGYEEAIEVAQIMDESIDESNMEMTIRCVGVSSDRMLANFSEEIQSSVSGTQLGFFSYFSAWWVYSKVVSLGVSVYERERRYHDAIKLLRELLNIIMYDSRRGYWALRLSIDLEHLGHFNESLSIAEKGVDDPWIRAGSKMALQRRVLRLGKPPRRWKIPSYAETVMRKVKEISISGRPLKNEIGEKSLFYGTDNELCGVEKLALQYYAEEGGGWQGIHSESGIWMTIFGLLMWGVIFSDVPNVFPSKFQVAPLDLLTDDFYVVRKTEIDSQLEKIHEGMAEEILITSWQLHEGTSCHGVSWDRFSLSDLRAAVSCIGGRSLALLCRHLAADYRSWSSGMPDLLLWRFHGNDMEGGEAKLVEVKGPRDRLSEQQRAWILTLMDCGIDTEGCRHVIKGQIQEIKLNVCKKERSLLALEKLKLTEAVNWH
ncbi:hypothetical protein KSP39_PZI015928 [Platanthera zijinensis]|uniref:Fanconi-associated nuclease n=1 Tax=Platanthera zijinensis TaxID=2320716 RepID=A0AAP0B8V4_9ASPA